MEDSHKGLDWESKINVFPFFEEENQNSKSFSDFVNLEKPLESGSSSSYEFDSSDTDDTDVSWPEVDIPGTWGAFGIEDLPWNDTIKPTVKFKQYNALQLNEIEQEGILTDRIIATGSSYLDRCPETGKYVLCKCALTNKSLQDISIIAFHHYLQFLDLSGNKLCDLTPLGQLPFLMYLDVSNNYLTELLQFKPPFNLTFVNYSKNKVQEIIDLTAFWSLVYLDLSHNRISLIMGLENLKYLRHLNLSDNNIERIENLNHMRLLTLDLENNKINTFEEGDSVGFKTLSEIVTIQLGYNCLTSLRMFKNTYNVQAIVMESNEIDDLMELNYLRGLNYLTEVSFSGNPISSMPNYEEACLDSMRTLYFLDGTLIEATEKVLAQAKFNPAPPISMANKHANLLLLEQLNHPLVGPPIVPADYPPPPIIILVGPLSSHKGELINMFYDQFKRYLVLGVSHTTRPKRENEIDGETYYFVTNEAFEHMARAGQFLTIYETLGVSFGLSHNEISKTTVGSAVLILHMDLIGALTLRAKGLRPRLVLTMPRTSETHKQWLREKYFHCPWSPSKFPKNTSGAVQIHNWPAKVIEAAAENEKVLSANATVTAKTILEEIVNAIPMERSITDVTGQTENQFSETLDEYINLEGPQEVQTDPETTSIDSSKFMDSERKVSGILKAAGKSKSQMSAQTRPSVSFQPPDETLPTPVVDNKVLDLDDLSNAISRLDSSHVTFNKVEYVEQLSPPTRPKVSASESSVTSTDMDTALSVLSTMRVEREQKDGTLLPLSNLDSMEQTDEYFDEILKDRNVYVDMHLENLGLFCAVIHSDEITDAIDKLKNVLKQCIKYQPQTGPMYEYSDDPVYRYIVAARLEAMHSEINRLVSPKIQRKMGTLVYTPDTPGVPKLFKRRAI